MFVSFCFALADNGDVGKVESPDKLLDLRCDYIFYERFSCLCSLRIIG